MRVLTVGAAGSSAGLVTRALANKGIEVRGLVHTAEKVSAARANGADQVVVADLNDRDALADALNGVDGVFHIIPAFTPDESATGLTMVELAADRGVGRFVFSSVYHPSLTDLSNHRDKQPAEQALYDSDLPFVVLQPAMFMSQLDGVVAQAQRSGVISGPYSADAAMSYVDYHDVAEVAAGAFVADDLVYGTFELSGPGMYSRTDLAALLTDLLGRVVTAEAASPDLPAGMSPSMRDGLIRMFAHYDRFGFHGGNAVVLRALLGRAPTTVPEYLSRAARR